MLVKCSTGNNRARGVSCEPRPLTRTLRALSHRVVLTKCLPTCQMQKCCSLALFLTNSIARSPGRLTRPFSIQSNATAAAKNVLS